jgi:hypothetical protein
MSIDNETNILVNYLDNVFMQPNNEQIKSILLSQLPTMDDIDIMCDSIKSLTLNNPGWINCGQPKCFAICSGNVTKEITSTAYYLRTLSASLLQLNKNEYKIVFIFENPQNITGIWERDNLSISFQIVKVSDNSIVDITSIPNSRLIMGFGPSASGKTYCAKQIINLMHMNDPTFPTFFLSIDGGIYRETCVIYQKILACIGGDMFSNNTAKGFSNLVSTSNPSLSIFDSNIVKRYINTYLQFLKTNKNIKINLYVPETLSGCLNTLCKSVYGKYIQITGDTNWIGILIWQHKLSTQCRYATKYGEKYRCKGCTESGMEREIKEGKKYSNAAWSISYSNGLNAVKSAPNHRFSIHNSGSPTNWTIFKDYSNQALNEDVLIFMDNNKWRYIDRTRQHNSRNLFGRGGKINSTKKQHKKVKTRKHNQNKKTKKHYKKSKKKIYK